MSRCNYTSDVDYTNGLKKNSVNRWARQPGLATSEDKRLRCILQKMNDIESSKKVRVSRSTQPLVSRKLSLFPSLGKRESSLNKLALYDELTSYIFYYAILQAMYATSSMT